MMNASPNLQTRSRNGGHGEKYTRKAEQAIAAILSQPTLAEAAEVAEVSEKTLWRWLQRDDFRQRLAEAQATVFDGALITLQASASEAVACLRRNLNSKVPTIQVQAAKSILNYSLRTFEMFTLKNRLAEIENQLAAREQADKQLEALISS
jgi:hypothetical protein